MLLKYVYFKQGTSNSLKFLASRKKYLSSRLVNVVEVALIEVSETVAFGHNNMEKAMYKGYHSK